MRDGSWVNGSGERDEATPGAGPEVASRWTVGRPSPMGRVRWSDSDHRLETGL